MRADEQWLLQRWTHSFEEDHEGVVVYRPADFAFPRARGRAGIEFLADGSFVDLAIGRGDAPEPRLGGMWRIDEDGRLIITSGAGERRVMDVVELVPERLQLHIREAA